MKPVKAWAVLTHSKLKATGITSQYPVFFRRRIAENWAMEFTLSGRIVRVTISEVRSK